MKQEFLMTRQQMDDIIAINKNQMPVMRFGGVSMGMDLQERINNYWKGLGNEYGFEPMTVEGSSKGELYFLATPCKTEKQIKDEQISKSIEKIQDLQHSLESEEKRLKELQNN